MEKLRDDSQEGKLKSATAIRCAKAAILLSSIRNVLSSSAADAPRIQNEDTEIQKLKTELVKLKQRMKKLRIFAGIWLILYFLCTLILLFAITLKFL